MNQHPTKLPALLSARRSFGFLTPAQPRGRSRATRNAVPRTQRLLALGAALACALTFLLGSVRAARADAIAATPPCPTGQWRSSGAHSAPTCGAQRCSEHAECPDGQACMPYCNVTYPSFGAPYVPTGRCSTNAECDPVGCVPLYCEVGERVPFTPSDAVEGTGGAANPADPSGEGAGGGAPGAGTSTGPSGDTLAEPNKRGVDTSSDADCAVRAVRAQPTALLALFAALLAALAARRLRP